MTLSPASRAQAPDACRAGGPARGSGCSGLCRFKGRPLTLPRETGHHGAPGGGHPVLASGCFGSIAFPKRLNHGSGETVLTAAPLRAFGTYTSRGPTRVPRSEATEKRTRCVTLKVRPPHGWMNRANLGVRGQGAGGGAGGRVDLGNDDAPRTETGTSPSPLWVASFSVFLAVLEKCKRSCLKSLLFVFLIL